MVRTQYIQKTVAKLMFYKHENLLQIKNDATFFCFIISVY